jgi:hypothetical protein
MAKRELRDGGSPLGRFLLNAKDRLTELADPAVREFKNQKSPSRDLADMTFKETTLPQTKDQPVNQQGIDPHWVEFVEASWLYREASGQIEETPCRGSSRDIQRAHKLFLKAPEHWYTHLDAVASLTRDPWHEHPDELKRRYMRRYGLPAGDAEPEQEDWPGAWDFLGRDFRYPQDIHFAYAAVADAIEAHGCIVIVPEQIRRKKPQVWRGYAGRYIYALGLLPQLLDWIEQDLSEREPAKGSASHRIGSPQEDVHVVLNADSRTLAIGEHQLYLKGQVWKLMRALVDEKLLNHERPRCSDWKNARDMLQRQLKDKGVNLTKVWPKAILETVEDRYILPVTVEIEKNSQRGIKKTHLAPPPRD